MTKSKKCRDDILFEVTSSSEEISFSVEIYVLTKFGSKSLISKKASNRK